MKIIIDTDPGIDDAMALLLAASSPKISIEAITNVTGNTKVDQCVRNTFKILDVCNRLDIPVYRGAEKPLIKPYFEGDGKVHGKDGLGDLNFPEVEKKLEQLPAYQYLIKTASEFPEEITLACIGPLTNIALAIQNDPNFAKNIKKLVIMGGAKCGGNLSPVAEFNIWDDPDAAKIVFEAGFNEIIVIGLDVTHKVILSPNLQELLKQYNTPQSIFISKITNFYNTFHWKSEKILGCYMHDPLVIGYLIDPEIFKLQDAFISIVTEGQAIGQTIVDINGTWNNNICNCKFAYQVDSKKFLEIFFNNIVPNQQEDNIRIINQEFSRPEY
ncbi:MAG: nucleoside hydrolase [Brevinemataceae bacterium]